ncbi:MAG: MarR family transcriptional regulator [Blautia sp.]|nr:MarR family transcriptional regulator [Blautia sp.]MDY5031350.1 MarR family transcriptional regulator [Blautia sp.]
MEDRIEALLRGSQYKQLREYEFSEIRKYYDLKRIEIEILYVLSKADEHNTSADICRSLRANKGHISQAMDHLCRKNYLTAVQDTSDRRYVHYRISDEAMEIVKKVTEKWEELNRELFAGVTPQELETLKNVAGKIGKNMERIIGRNGR